MLSNFDRTVNRLGTYSATWDCIARKYGEDIISLGVAEMEFETCPDVKKAILSAADRGIYSYTEIFPEFGESCVSWFSRRHKWDFSSKEVLFAPRIIQLTAAVFNHLFRKAKVATFSPYYAPIIHVIASSGAKLRKVSLRNDNGMSRWCFDKKKLADAFADADVFVLTNPHNPTGRVWTYDELMEIAKLAEKHDVMLFSDDIHCDILRSDMKWIPVAGVVAENNLNVKVITCVSPAKSFNIAGIETAAAIVNDKELYKNVAISLEKTGIFNPNYFALPAAIAAWNSDGIWLNELNRYLSDNLSYTVERFAGKTSDFTCYVPEATYLLWIAAFDFLKKKNYREFPGVYNGVSVSPGKYYGKEWSEYFRLSVGLPRKTLDLAINRITESL